MEPIDVFVYGTLKRGYGNNRILASSQFVEEATTEPDYLVVDSGFPIAVYRSPYQELRLPIQGEIYEVNSEAVLARLDALEGNGRFYTRQRRVINGRTCWIYELDQGNVRSAVPEGELLQPDDDGVIRWGH
jgi:gamma-glutamylcyclotransferase (GGCT)/AIG2-like uncharacterized protein YtfP